jgi:hypothetical protein
MPHSDRQDGELPLPENDPCPAEWDATTPTLRRVADALRSPVEVCEETYRLWRERLVPQFHGGSGRARLWTSEPDRRGDTAPVTHRMRCDDCGRRSHASAEFGTVRAWLLDHAASHPTHRTYTETVTRPWRARKFGEGDRTC